MMKASVRYKKFSDLDCIVDRKNRSSTTHTYSSSTVYLPEPSRGLGDRLAFCAASQLFYSDDAIVWY